MQPGEVKVSKYLKPRVRQARRRKLTLHASGRGSERWGLRQNEIDLIRKRIQTFLDGGARINPSLPVTTVVMEQESVSRTRLAVFFNERWIPVIYHKKKQTLVTFLPEETLDNFVPPRLATAEEQKAAWLAGEEIPGIIYSPSPN